MSLVFAGKTGITGKLILDTRHILIILKYHAIRLKPFYVYENGVNFFLMRVTAT